MIFELFARMIDPADVCGLGSLGLRRPKIVLCVDDVCRNRLEERDEISLPPAACRIAKYADRLFTLVGGGGLSSSWWVPISSIRNARHRVEGGRLR